MTGGSSRTEPAGGSAGPGMAGSAASARGRRQA